MSRHKTGYVISYYGILCHDMLYVTTIAASLVTNCRQQLSRPILWIVAVCATYWTHTTAVHLLMVALTRLRLPTHPPPPYTHHL